jgi:hypothetical protein
MFLSAALTVQFFPHPEQFTSFWIPYAPHQFEQISHVLAAGLQPLCSSGRMPSTVTVPPVTGVLIRARKVPDTLPARYSVVVFAGTVIVVNPVQVAPKLDKPAGVIAAFPGQHLIVTALADTEPLPVTLNVVNLGSSQNWVTPTPVVPATWNAYVTFPVMALPSLRSLRSQMTPETTVAALRGFMRPS